ncbi:melanoma antigen recognized by T-cells 1 [Ornithorhynchus anatinus]|uniref:Melan-A n=1 Tax=Ornithorhynchus anatinus TaxID=9258 RepID=A0A6I8NMJ4_ORNAN|nr:melanoma antigen recognized by T-cells 1 [Ornithorhynchus anatinus]
MPAGNSYFSDGYLKRKKGYSYITPEEAAGLGILVVILGLLLLIGCWYYRRRNGYKILKYKSLQAGTGSALMGRYHSEEGAPLDCKMPFPENGSHSSVVPDAPPAYEKVISERAPPAYSP